MSGRPRSLAELKDTEAHIHPHENELVVPVTHAEALKLHKTGAIVFSGCSRVNREPSSPALFSFWTRLNLVRDLRFWPAP